MGGVELAAIGWVVDVVSVDSAVVVVVAVVGGPVDGTGVVGGGVVVGGGDVVGGGAVVVGVMT